MRRMAIDPSPTADATRLVDPWRTSPTANTPGRLVSNGIGGRSSGQPAGGRPSSSRSVPVSTNPHRSRRMGSGSQSVWGSAPIRMNSAVAGAVWVVPGGAVLEGQGGEVAVAVAIDRLGGVADNDVGAAWISRTR